MTGFDWVLPGFTGFYWVLPGLTGFDWVLPGFTGFYWVLPSFTDETRSAAVIYWALTGFCLLLGGANIFLMSDDNVSRMASAISAIFDIAVDSFIRGGRRRCRAIGRRWRRSRRRLRRRRGRRPILADTVPFNSTRNTLQINRKTFTSNRNPRSTEMPTPKLDNTLNKTQSNPLKPSQTQSNPVKPSQTQ